MTPPKPPLDLKNSGRAMWIDLTSRLDLDVHELSVLHQVGRTADRCDDLDRAIRKDGVVTPDGRPHPLLRESREQSIALARLIAALRLPVDIADPAKRPQRHGGARGIYKIVSAK